ncbi:MAG TPA: AAA family ATPase [Rhodanobacteraceae bacterium]
MPDVPDPAKRVEAARVQAQLERVLAADAFRGAPVLSRLLRYLVDASSAGTLTPPKEYAIGVDVFGRGADFDPRVDTIVRVQARRLRKRLARYYETDGAYDRLRIGIPKGHYHAELEPRPGGHDRTSGDGESRNAAAAPASAPRAFRTNVGAIPAPRTGLIGRAREVSELRALLTAPGGSRLVTLTGAGGSGKTRLAVEIGLALRRRRRSVCYVKLAGVPDVPTFQLALLRAFGLSATDTAPPIETVRQHLAAARNDLLLILDNLEHLVAAAPLIGVMLDASPRVRVLVTSRIALHLYGEQEYRVTPLPTPLRDSAPLEELAAVPSVELFVQRAATACPGFALTDANAASVAAICRHLDGLPLGIELAAAQCHALTAIALARRFPGYLDVRATNVVDAPSRQRTLRDTIDWSYQLLSASEQALFRRLAVFSNGFTQEAAVAVADTHADLGIDVASGIGRLRDCSLIYNAVVASEPRYAMLATLRTYGLERLAESGESTAVHRAHAAYCLVLAEEGAACRTVAAREQWLARCDEERDNFQTALDGLAMRGDATWALSLACALHGYWKQREHIATARRSLAAVLNRFDPTQAPALWSRAACHAGSLEGQAGNATLARAYFDRALAVARSEGNAALECMVLASMAVHESLRGHHGLALRRYAECLDVCEATGSPERIAAAMSNVSTARLALARYTGARQLLERARIVFHTQQAREPQAWCTKQLGDVAMLAGDYATAKRQYRAATRRFAQLGQHQGVVQCQSCMGHLALLNGRRVDAARLFAGALRTCSREKVPCGAANLIEGCAMLEATRSRGSRAAVLAGAAAAAHAARGLVAYPYERRRLQRLLAPIRKTLTRRQATVCHARGASMRVATAIAYAEAGLKPGLRCWKSARKPSVPMHPRRALRAATDHLLHTMDAGSIARVPGRNRKDQAS